MNKKAQGWGIDLIIGVIVFTIGLVVFFLYSVNYSPIQKENFESIYKEAVVLSESLMSEGSPHDWDPSNVMRIGILSGNKIDQSKIDSFYNLSLEDYNKTKRLLNTRYDYYIVIPVGLEAGTVSIEGIGKFIDLSNITAENLVKITRASTYKNKPVSIDIYVWD